MLEATADLLETCAQVECGGVSTSEFAGGPLGQPFVREQELRAATAEGRKAAFSKPGQAPLL